MTPADRDYLQRLIDAGLIYSPCLELGAALLVHSAAEALKSANFEYVGTDREPGPFVDIVVDFDADGEVVRERFGRQFGSVLVFNVLEHTIDPIRVLDNAVSLVRPGGTCAVLTPAVWPLHSYPHDCWRINLDFYVQYARKRRLELVAGTLQYVGHGPVQKHTDPDGNVFLPRPWRNAAARWYGRVIHRLFNTYGRSTQFKPHVATAALFLRSQNEIELFDFRA